MKMTDGSILPEDDGWAVRAQWPGTPDAVDPMEIVRVNGEIVFFYAAMPGAWSIPTQINYCRMGGTPQTLDTSEIWKKWSPGNAVNSIGLWQSGPTTLKGYITVQAAPNQRQGLVEIELELVNDEGGEMPSVRVGDPSRPPCNGDRTGFRAGWIMDRDSATPSFAVPPPGSFPQGNATDGFQSLSDPNDLVTCTEAPPPPPPPPVVSDGSVLIGGTGGERAKVVGNYGPDRNGKSGQINFDLILGRDDEARGWFYNEDNPELYVSAVTAPDGTSLWIKIAQLTAEPWSVTVTDTQTGKSRTYTQADVGAALIDTETFRA